MIRLSGSVKLRCAESSGFACSGSGTCGGRPPIFFPVSSSCCCRSAILASASAFFCSAFRRASLEAHARPTAEQNKAEAQARIAERQQQEEETGKKIGARAPRAREQQTPKP